MSNNILNVAIHDLKRTSSGFQVSLGTKKLSVTGTIQRVIDDLYDLYSRRASKSHGKFSTNPDNFPTEMQLRDYVSGKDDFSTFTSRMMSTLQHQAGQRGAATGGHVFFAQFQRDTKMYLLVAIVTDKLGAALTQDLDVKDAEHLDMEGFRFAGRINITGWQGGEDRYIGFLKGKGNVSEYFKEFLGCDNTIQDRKDTTDLVDALKGFADREKMSKEAREEFLAKAKSICERASQKREELEFEAFANELMPSSPSTLLNALVHPDLRLNDQFIPDRRALAGLVKFRGRTSLWSIEFDREALIKGKIYYNSADDTLILTDLPEELRAQLKHETDVPAS